MDGLAAEWERAEDVEAVAGLGRCASTEHDSERRGVAVESVGRCEGAETSLVRRKAVAISEKAVGTMSIPLEGVADTM